MPTDRDKQQSPVRPEDGPAGQTTAGGRDRGASSTRRLVPGLKRWLHYRFPNIAAFQEPEARNRVQSRDAKKNLETRVPPEEELRQRALWGVEIFGPTEIDGLYSALKRLEWDEDGPIRPGDSVLKWISEQRMYGSEGARNLGVIHRKGQKKFLPIGRHAPIPDVVDYMHGYVYQVSPSITAVILCFVLFDESSTLYESVLNSDHTTINERHQRNGGYRVLGVEHIKRSAIEDVRTKSRAIVSNWFQENLPGYFSLALDGNRLPTAELLTNIRQSILVENLAAARDEPEWARLMKNFGIRNTWALCGFDGLSLAWDETEGQSRFHMIVQLRTDFVKEEHLRGTRSYTTFVSDHIEGVLVHFAVIAALREVVRTLRLTRDTLSAESIGRHAVLRTVGQIRAFFVKSIGLPTMTSELAARSEKDHSYSWECEDFQCEPWRPDDKPTKIAEALRARTHYLSSRALAQEKETREHLEQLSTILNIQESIRTQRRMEIVAIATTVLAAASLIVALMSIDRVASAVNSYVERILSNK